MDYRLSDLGPRTFEQLVQALWLKFVSPTSVIFGDGPDGGREATYDGPTTLNDKSGDWDGYVVLQAKYRQPTDSENVSGGPWLRGEINSEISDFLDAAKNRRRPQYYIVATNVTLGGAQDTGYKDKIDTLLSSRAFGLTGFDVWDYTKICRLLDQSPEIVRTYCAWITPGDVLSAALSHFEQSSPDFESTLHRYLSAELLQDRHANLEQAGHHGDEKVPIASVFVDLPVGESKESENRVPFVASILETASERLSPSALSDQPESLRRRSRTTLVGGPGQGKTTLGQFVCQLHRAAILESRPDRLDTEVQDALATIDRWCEEGGVPLPTARRFPLRIVLSHFAVELGRDGGPRSILEYLVDDINREAVETLDPATFRRWLAAYPWVLVLDGLDEVPASSNRDEVISAVKTFVIDVAELDADVLIIPTTRPQGYSDEFDPKYYDHLFLQPLQPDEALGYGNRLAEVRFGHEERRFERIVGRLQTAARHRATARLMTSPLQVTIMTVLVDRHGQPPQERWTLFSLYYKAIYSRELERDVATSEILRTHQAHVDEIHRQVALILQRQSEGAAGTDARMPKDDFSRIVRDHLASEGYDGAALDKACDDIAEAAGQRLVFLVGLEEGLVGFEIRSLQEFMAAERLMADDASLVISRLEAIGGVASWRNVTLFAAGKCFADPDRRYLRDSVIRIASELNSPDDVAQHVLAAGSELAIDLLDDGSVANQPKYARQLASIGLASIGPAGPSFEGDLSRVYQSSLEDCYQRAINVAMDSADETTKRRAGALLLFLAARGVDWAHDQLINDWDRHRDTVTRPDAQLDIGRLDGTLRRMLYAELLQQPAWIAARWLLLNQRRPLPPDAPDWLAALRDLVQNRRRQSTSAEILGSIELSTFVPTLDDLMRADVGALVDVPADGDGWHCLRAIARFATRPSLTTAAELVDADIKDPERQARQPYFPELPGILSAIESEISAGSSLETVTKGIREGAYGTFDDWLRLDEALRSSVIQLDRSLGLTIAEAISGGVLPARAIDYAHPTRPSGGAMSAAHSLFQSVMAIEDEYDRAQYATWLVAILSDAVGHDANYVPDLGLFEWETLCRATRHPVDARTAVVVAERIPNVTDDDRLKFVELLGDSYVAPYSLVPLEGEIPRVATGLLYRQDPPPGAVKTVAATSPHRTFAGSPIVDRPMPEIGDPTLQFAYALVRFDPPNKDATSTAADFSGLPNHLTSHDALSRLASRMGATREWREALLLALHRSVAGRLNLINEIVAERESPLRDSSVWEELGLGAFGPA